MMLNLLRTLNRPKESYMFLYKIIQRTSKRNQILEIESEPDDEEEYKLSIEVTITIEKD